jgi:hypothetical protein
MALLGLRRRQQCMRLSRMRRGSPPCTGGGHDDDDDDDRASVLEQVSCLKVS